MASKQSHAVSRLYESWLTIPAQNPDWTPEDDRDLVEGWNVLTTEPGGVDYLEVDAAGVAAMWVVPKGCADDRALLCMHGGGFVSGSMYTHRKMFAHLAKRIGVRALIVGYRLLPDGVHPAPVDDVYAAYDWLLDQGIEAGHVAFTGDSAGGGLAITGQLRARQHYRPLPAAAMLISPWIDMEGTGASYEFNADKDALFNKDFVAELAAGFLGGTDPRDPYVNALHAELGGLGPVYVQVGEYELLLDDSRQFAECATQAGVDVRLDVFPEMQHTFQMMAGRAPEADDAIDRLAAWARPRLGLDEAAGVDSAPAVA